MTNYPALIQLLADGAFHSGEEIGRQLGVSRAAVWKQLPGLSDFGLEVESVKGRGYRLVNPIELLDRDQLSKFIDGERLAQLSEFECLFDVHSTNDRIQQKCQAGLISKGYLCLAEFQRKGRGRRGRDWLSPLGCNLMLSLLWEFEGGAVALEGLSLSIGIAVVRALKKLGLCAQLKWPNDILVDNNKLGGILIEMSGDPAGVCQVIIGVGLNVHMSQIDGVGQPWTSVIEYLPEISRNQLGGVIIDELIGLLYVYPALGFSALREEWLSYDAFLGQDVMVNVGDRVHFGKVLGVAINGALKLDIDGVEAAIHGGEVSLRLAR